jgi:SAM-dependent methyltransferase
MSPFHEVSDIPVHSVLLMPSQPEARDYPRGDLVLGFCDACGFLSNLVFDPSVHEYSTRYEETQGFSPTFNAFARDLARRWVEKYDLHGKTVVEIGCGKGEFLALLCEIGDNRGVGIDPSAIPERLDSPAADRIEFIQDFYSEKYASLEGDFICCRHTLEHIGPTKEFLEIVRRSVEARTDTIVAFELPDVSRVLRELAFWDIYYEHCSYFSLGSLARLFRSCDFEILDLSLDYGDQYILIEAKPGAEEVDRRRPGEDDMDRLRREVDHFRRHISGSLEAWKKDFRDWREEKERVVLWGAGSKGVAFLTTLGVQDEIEYCVDINPHKRGHFMPGTGHQIVSPEFLTEYRPDRVVVMNPIYCDEIGADLERLGLSPAVDPITKHAVEFA